MIVPLLAGVVKYLVFKQEGDASLRSASFGQSGIRKYRKPDYNHI